jgi:predicted lipoprotein
MLAIAASGVAGCKIKYDSDKSAGNQSAAFDAKTYVGKLWDAKVVPLMQADPIDVGTVLDAIAKDPEAAGKQYGHRAGEGQPWTYLVKGEGKVTALDVASRHGTATVETTIDGKPTPVVLQVGPVIFGTALRDALPFIAFGDFVNQIDYAEVSRALNDRATAGFAKEMAGAEGKTVSFAGAAITPSGSSPLTITPVLLTVAGSSQ